MKGHGLVAAIMLTASTMTGCAATDDEYEFRAADNGDFWEWDLQDPANGDIEVRDADDDDVIIWDFTGGGVARQTQPGQFADELVVQGNEVQSVDQQGAAMAGAHCTALDAGHPSGKVYYLQQADGEIALTLWNRRVFSGHVAIPSEGAGNALDGQVAFSFKKDRIHVGPWSDGVVAATTSTDVDDANPMRQMVLGSLVLGECGAAGLP